LKTGLRLAIIGYKGENRTGLRWGSEHDGMGGWVLDPTLPHEIQLIDDYWFIELPIGARIRLNNKKLNPFFEFGVSPSIYLTTKTKIITDIDTSTKFNKNSQDEFNKIQMVGFISLGMNYYLNENIQIFGQPIIRYHLTKMADALINENLFNYGIEIGIRKRIK